MVMQGYRSAGARLSATKRTPPSDNAELWELAGLLASAESVLQGFEPQMYLYKVSEIAKLVDTEASRIQHWCETGVLRSEPSAGGTVRGKYKLLRGREIQIAALVKVWADEGLPVTQLGALAGALRDLNVQPAGASWDNHRFAKYGQLLVIAEGAPEDPLHVFVALSHEGAAHLAFEPLRWSERACLEFRTIAPSDIRCVRSINVTAAFQAVIPRLRAKVEAQPDNLQKQRRERVLS